MDPEKGRNSASQTEFSVAASDFRDGGVRGEVDEGVGGAQVCEGPNVISSRLEEIDKNMEEQAGRIDAVQAKVDLMMSSITDVLQEQVSVAKGVKASQQMNSPLAATKALLPLPPLRPPPPPLQVPRPHPQSGSSLFQRDP